MAIENRVLPLSESGGLPVVPGATLVSYQIASMYIAFIGPFNYRYQTLAILYKDDSGKWLVAAESDVFDSLPVGVTLAEHVDVDPSLWDTWKCDGYTENGAQVNFGKQKKKTKKMQKNISSSKPIKLKDDSKEYAIGAQATAVHKMDFFDPSVIEAGTVWWGDENV